LKRTGGIGRETRGSGKVDGPADKLGTHLLDDFIPDQTEEKGRDPRSKRVAGNVKPIGTKLFDPALDLYQEMVSDKEGTIQHSRLGKAAEKGGVFGLEVCQSVCRRKRPTTHGLWLVTRRGKGVYRMQMTIAEAESS